MKITLTPSEGKEFAAADLRNQLNRWLGDFADGVLRAHVTPRGKLKSVELDIVDREELT